MRWFTAKYPGWCRACGTSFLDGAEIGFNSDRDLVARQCCKGKDEFESVMPIGKTKEDTCTECYMVHSNGQEGCE